MKYIAILLGLSGLLSSCASAQVGAQPSKLASEPSPQQITAIQTAVREAMKRSDLAVDAIRLFDSPQLTVRPVAVPGMTDRVPGRPRKLVLLSDGPECWLWEARTKTRIELPDGLVCTRAR